MDGSESTLEATALTDNFTASPYLPVTFDNYIYDFRASAVFLQPPAGETIKFKASFAAYSDWTLIISNQSAVTVRTVTGSGKNMTFVWNGTDDNNATVAANGYSATLVAAEATPPAPAPGPDPGPPPSPEGAQGLIVTDDGSGVALFLPRSPAEAAATGWAVYFPPLPPMPPVKKDGKWQSWEEVFGPLPLISLPVPNSYLTPVQPIAEGLDSPTPDAPAAAGAATNTLIPLRFVYRRGTVGFAAQGHHPSFGFGNNNRPANGLGGRVTLNGNTGITGAFGLLRAPPRIFYGFYNALRGAGYQAEFYKKDNELAANELRGPQYGGTNIFEKVNIGLLVGHGVFGTTPDFTISASGPLETYFPIYKSGVNSYDWVRFTQFQFGSSGSDLRWMGILSCNNMIGDCYDDMYNKELLPIGDDLHLLLGAQQRYFCSVEFW